MAQNSKQPLLPAETVRRSLSLVAATVVAATVLAAASTGASSAAGLKGEWVSRGPAVKIVLSLTPAGKTYRGTYTQTPRGGKAKISRVVARLDNADGAKLVTLTFTSDGHSVTCGLRGAKLYCQTATGTATFVRT
jgi:hypothetical protein